MQGKRNAAYFGRLAILGLALPSGFGAFPAGIRTAEARDASIFFRESAPDHRFRPEPVRRPDLRTRASVKPPVKQSGKQKDAAPPPGPHLLIVSVRSQRLSLYAGGKLVAQSPVSTGTETHPTPHGVFSIIQKNRHHRSNIYDDAPMPYMQRLTWSGVALHQGALPGRPASHGCIRLPEQFASLLWRTTRLGARVVISSEDVAPYDVAHVRLFQPKAAPATVDIPDLRPTLETTTPSLTRTAGIDVVLTNVAAESADDAVEALRPTGDENTTTSLDPQNADIPDVILESFAQALEAKQKRITPSGPVSVFISRKDKRLYVRQGFIPLFTASINLRDENTMIGTHVVTAFNRGGDTKELRWAAVTLPPEPPKTENLMIAHDIDARGRRVGPSLKPQANSQVKISVSPVPSIGSVLDRIDISQEVADRVSEYITAGASVIVSDHGLGYETGLYTDFIVVTR